AERRALPPGKPPAQLPLHLHLRAGLEPRDGLAQGRAPGRALERVDELFGSLARGSAAGDDQAERDDLVPAGKYARFGRCRDPADEDHLVVCVSHGTTMPPPTARGIVLRARCGRSAAWISPV